MLTPKIVALIKETSTYGVLGYFETRYFSDKGDQGAVFAQLGEITFGPQIGAGSINQMLHLLGARAQDDRDEFDAVGLGRFRDNQGWIENPGARASTETMTMTGKVISWIHGLGKK